MLSVTVQSTASAHTRAKAQAFAERSDLPWVASREEAGEFALVFDDENLALHARARHGESAKRGWLRPLAADFAQMDVTSPQGRRKNQPLAKALGLKVLPTPIRVIDATAGLGKDSFLIAALGCSVLAVERSPVVSMLLQDAVARAAATRPEIAARIALLEADARHLSQKSVDQKYDVVYLDPMFPPSNKSAREKNEMRFLRQIVGGDEDAAELFSMACKMAAKRIVVKRPAHAPPLAPDPVASHAAKGIRYDVYSIAVLHAKL